ncbi:pyridoxamine 5'-phosphate oxidase family protein [Modestobacter roseus]|uniref:Pyridoxamine 5'-phosphate oxidase-like protein n=1 Tax=Modestobacter roseus TaxID=1181884 RepID=A0A562IQH6_9ACTN|nr:pyridoxamine 5'-phosphate oxidase family protein [Modestobacter roseus]TWH73120.1 pyridoxamine 5'-phosphate oxidase-like protein [Modestobacter roseus]
MSPTGAGREPEALRAPECLRLLGTRDVGRIAFTAGALPVLQPVSYLLSGQELLVPVDARSELADAARAAVLALQVDDVDADGRTGWDVTVLGPSRLVHDPDQVARLDRWGVRPWFPATRHCYVMLRAATLSGRRLRTGPAPRPSTGTTSVPIWAR